MIINCLGDESWIFFPHQLIVNSNAVISQSFPVIITDTFAYLQKFVVILNRLFVFFDVVVEDADWVISSAFIPHLSCSPAAKSQHLVVLQPAHNCHVGAIVHFLLIQSLLILGFICLLLLLHKSWGSIEEKGQLDSMRHWRGHWTITPTLVEVSHIIFLGQGASDSERPVKIPTVMVAFCSCPALIWHSIKII